MLSIADTLIIIFYIAGVLILGLVVGKSNKSADDYFLAGRTMPWLPVAISVAATMISANGFIGGPGWAYESGLSPYMVNIGVPLAIVLVMSTTVPVFYNLRFTSIYEYMEARLGVRTRLLVVAGFFANSVIQVSSMVFIPALIINTFTGWDLRVVIPVVVVTAIIYTISGGIRAVIWTDVAQMAVLWSGLLVALAIILGSLGAGLTDTLGALREAGKLKALDFSLDMTRTEGFWATLIGGTVMWVRYFGFDQVQVQRVLTARSMAGIKRSFFISALMMNSMYFIFMAVGVLLYGFYGGREFPNANAVMIDFIGSHLPVGVIGLVIAGIFAAAMSSIDSLLNSMTTVFVKDIYERFFTSGKLETSLKMSRWLTLCWGVIIIVFALLGFSGTTKSILATVGSYISYISGPMCGAFLLAFFTVRANDKGVVFGVAAGFAATLAIGLSTPVSWIWKPAIGMVLTVAVGYGASLLFKSSRSPEEAHRFTLLGQRQQMIEAGRTAEGDTVILPLSFDRYALYTLVFFLAQYAVLAIIGR